MNLRSSPCTLYVLLALFVLSAAAAPALADEVRLANGDRLSGTAVALADGTLTFETDYAGELAVDWSAVVALTVDEPATFVFQGEGEGAAPFRLRGPATSPEEGTVRIDAASVEETATVALADVVAINPVEKPPVEVSGHLNAGFQDRSGNTETQDLHVDGEIVARTETSRYSLGASVDESETDGEETSSRSSLYTGYDYFVSERWYLSSNARFTKDEFQALDLRSSFGVGGGYQVWDADRRTLSVELGVNWVDEDFIDAPGEEYTAGRWKLDLGYELSGDGGVRLFHRHEALFSLEDGDDYVLLTQTGLRFLLLEHLNATVAYDVDYDNSPAPGQEEEDRRFTLSLGYAW